LAGAPRLDTAGISRFASVYDGLQQGFLSRAGFEAIVQRDLADGQHRNPEAHPGWFTTAYLHRPEELADELTEAGSDAEGPFAVEGPGLFAPGLDEWLDDEERRERLRARSTGGVRAERDRSHRPPPSAAPRSVAEPRVSANYQNEPVSSVPSASSCSIVFV
jgi:hypothetical protein